ncbi:GNAT family N-acetyltransferase [Psychroflexus montanilacus]|uniref:GNAT family N-acetyltransferase n=1 Tax=Psychroflexus montanilacus TaxID=2873598 RepID=UPI001CC9EC26|nr:GNAT family N-acetyltransferase [Psychroflexus montanilacus]MBZ9652831.1 GNAT family N-acetyltransferase [Psychroflexus montanilacus]
MQITFTPIQPKELDQVIHMFQAAADKISRMNIDHWQYWKNPPSEKIEWVKEGLANGEYFLVKNEAGDTLGMLRILDKDLMYWGEQEEKAKYIHSLVVQEKFNGKGLGVKIIEKVAEEAKKQDCKYLRLDADSKNPNLCRYYEKQGFEQVGAKTLSISTYNLYQKLL